MSNKQPEALRLADELDELTHGQYSNHNEAADKLRSQHELIAEMRGAAKLAIEYWEHRQQRYKNRAPAWVQETRAAIAKATGEQS